MIMIAGKGEDDDEDEDDGNVRNDSPGKPVEWCEIEEVRVMMMMVVVFAMTGTTLATLRK